MDTKTYGVLASATRVKRPEYADEGDLLIIPPGNPIRSMNLRTIARMGLRCGNTCRSTNTYKAVDQLFRKGKADAPIVLRISDAQKSSAPSGRRAQMLALIGNGREIGEEPQAAIYRCDLQLIYNGQSLPRYADDVTAVGLMSRVGDIMERIHMSNVSSYDGAIADVATMLAWQSFAHAEGVIDETKPRATALPMTDRRGDSARDWNVGGGLSAESRRHLARFLAVDYLAGSALYPVNVTGRFLAEAGKRGCVVVKCPQTSVFATRARLKAHAELCAEAWRCRARALEAMRRFALKDLATARYRAAHFDKIARGVADKKADYAFLQCMSGWNK